MESRKLGFRPKHFPKNATATLNDQHFFRMPKLKEKDVDGAPMIAHNVFLFLPKINKRNYYYPFAYLKEIIFSRRESLKINDYIHYGVESFLIHYLL